MAKVFAVTLIVESEDDSHQPTEEVWSEAILATVPGIAAIGGITFQDRPYACLEDDPEINGTLH